MADEALPAPEGLPDLRLNLYGPPEEFLGLAITIWAPPFHRDGAASGLLRLADWADLAAVRTRQSGITWEHCMLSRGGESVKLTELPAAQTPNNALARHL